MHWVLTVISLILMAPFAGITFIFAVEVFAGLSSRGRAPRVVEATDVAIVVPANDEALVIGRMIGDLFPQLPPGYRLLIVADNCTDRTASLARSAGATVIERQDATRRGKGFALAFARDHLRADPPAVVVILDADCRIDRSSLACLAGTAKASDRPAQAINLLSPDLSASPMVQVSNFAFLIKNLFRQRGLFRLSGRVHLTGTGMALSWRLFDGVKLATDDIVEDLSMGLDLAEQGFLPHFVEGATVWSNASTAEGTQKQRARWEGGFLANSLRRGLPDAWSACRRFDPPSLWAALSLLVPPVALLAMLDIFVLVATALSALAGASYLVPVVLICAITFAFFAVMLAWLNGGRAFLSGAAALRVPGYVLWKIPLYLGMLGKQRKAWVRTGR